MPEVLSVAPASLLECPSVAITLLGRVIRTCRSFSGPLRITDFLLLIGRRMNWEAGLVVTSVTGQQVVDPVPGFMRLRMN